MRRCKCGTPLKWRDEVLTGMCTECQLKKLNREVVSLRADDRRSDRRSQRAHEAYCELVVG